MSRAYRIRVQETLRRVLRAHDGVSTQLEILEILPPEQMAQLLADELERRGYQRQGDKLQRALDGATVTVDPRTGTVSVHADACAEVELEGEKEGRIYNEPGAEQDKLKKDLHQALRDDLGKQADRQEAQLQGQLSDRLEAQLGDLRRELDQVVNRVTAEALKRKAAQLGQIKEMTEDPQSGSLTIVLEV